MAPTICDIIYAKILKNTKKISGRKSCVNTWCFITGCWSRV